MHTSKTEESDTGMALTQTTTEEVSEPWKFTKILQLSHNTHSINAVNFSPRKQIILKLY